MTKNAFRAYALSLLALALAACSSDYNKGPAVNPNLYPSQYKAEVIATLRPMFVDNETATVSGAEISQPVLTPVGKDQRYSLCVHYTAHGTSPGDAGVSTRRGYFFGGHLNQLIPVSDDECKGVAYQPFNELNRLCLGNACAKRAKPKGGWSLF